MGASTSKHKTKTDKHRLHAAAKPLPPGKPTLKYDPNDSDPDNVTIKWDPPQYDGGSKITGYLVEHKRTGSPHWVKASPIKVRQTQLTICGLEPGWRYQFRITAENEIGYSDPSPLSEPLAIFVHRSAAIAPYFVDELRDMTVLENEKIEFNVTFEGLPTPKISWYRDGLEIFSNRRQRISTDGCVSNLVIYEASMADESEIKCSATNRVGYAVTRANLTVEAPPTIRLPRQYEDGLIFEKGETIRLKVSVVGRPQPFIYWYLNGEEIIPSPKHEIEYEDENATLKVKYAQRSDRGEYQVQAINDLGEEVASILVTIASKPQPPTNITVEKVFGTSVTLSWSPPEDDGGCKIGSYIVEYHKTNWNVWLKATTSRQLRITLDDLIEASQYKFRVKAENPYGVSDPSPETQIIFIPDPKRGIFEALQTFRNSEFNITSNTHDAEGIHNATFQDFSERETDSEMSGDFPRKHSFYIDSQTETDDSTETLDRKKLQPVKPTRKHKTKTKVGNNVSNRNVLYPNGPGYGDVHKVTNYNYAGSDRGLTPSPQPSTNMDDTSRTSSELMLVSVPSQENVYKNRIDGSSDRPDTINHNFSNQHSAPPPPPSISLSAPELGSEMQLFKPLQRNCVSSTEILHESTIARFYKQLQEEEAEMKSADKFTPPTRKKLVKNFHETSQLLINRHERNQTKLIATKELDSDVVTDLRKIDEHGDDEVLTENSSLRAQTLINEKYKYPNDNSPILGRTSINESVRLSDRISPTKPSLTKQKTFDSTKNTIPESVIERDDESGSADVSKISSFLVPEAHPQGRYSPRSGTFHYPDLFMESLTKSPKFKATSASLSEVVGELIARRHTEVPSYSGEPSMSSLLLRAHENERNSPNYDLNDSKTARTSDINSCSSTRSEDIFDENEAKDYESWREDKSNSLKTDTETEDSLSNDESDSDEYEIDDEMDTYHPSDSAPLSFEQALAISNPKRSVSPTNDMFLESETPFYDDENERDLGLHYFNKNYTELDHDHQKREQSASIKDEEKVPKSILKPNCESMWNNFSINDQNRSNMLLSGQHRNRSLKKQVRIEEPYKQDELMQLKKATDDNDTSFVIINHYSDIVKQFGNVQKPSTKVYLTYEELKAAAQRVELEDKEEEQIDHQPFLRKSLEHEVPEVCRNDDTEPATTAIDTKTEIVHQRVHFFFNFFLDVVMFAFACWLFFFKDEKLAIPIIVLMVYRQLYNKIKTKLRRFRTT